MDRSVCVLLTTYNRAETTLKALDTIDDERLKIDYLVVDDLSTDDTRQVLREWNSRESYDGDSPVDNSHRRSRGDLKIIKGTGSLFWAGGMRKGMEFLSEPGNAGKYDHLVLINDDVTFYPDTLIRMIERSEEKGNEPVTGVTRSRDGSVSYGGVKYDMARAKLRFMDITEAEEPCDTMNCNCFLMPWKVFTEAGAFDDHYVHSLADYDYGFKLKRMGHKVWLTDFYVGECEDNQIEGTWRDVSLGRLERLKKKESVKELPRKQWFYYLKKNFGLRQAVWHSITPYLRIIVGK